MGSNELVTCPGRVDITHKIINGDRLQYLQVTLSGGQSRKMGGRTEVGTKMMSNEYTGVLCCIQPVFLGWNEWHHPQKQKANMLQLYGGQHWL